MGIRKTRCLFWVLILSLPTGAMAKRHYRVVSGDSLSVIAERYGCLRQEIIALNPQALAAPDKLALGQRLRIPDRCQGAPSTRAASGRAKGRRHVVASGESIWSIASLYHCSQAELMHANRNRIQDPRLIQIGTELAVPKCSGGPVGGGRGRAVTDCNWTADNIEEGRLKTLMKAKGFKPPPKFRALLIETLLSRNSQRIVSQRLISWGKLASTHQGWNPASTVKLYSAISALERVRRYGFGIGSQVTFHYARGKRTFPLKQLFEDAVHWSKNIPHNRLVQLAGFDYLNGAGGTLHRAGLEHTYIMRAYDQTAWMAEGHSRWLRDSPKITLREGRKRRTLAPRKGRGKYPCGGAACTSLSDLAKTMCRMMLHEQLPASRRLRLGGDGQSPHLKLLRRSMDRKRKGRTDKVWDAIENYFPADKGYILFRKAGFSRDWLSENMYIYNSHSHKRWIIALAGFPGRGSLTQAAKVLSQIIRADAL